MSEVATEPFNARGLRFVKQQIHLLEQPLDPLDPSVSVFSWQFSSYDRRHSCAGLRVLFLPLYPAGELLVTSGNFLALPIAFQVGTVTVQP
jgi:hypothetical protein